MSLSIKVLFFKVFECHLNTPVQYSIRRRRRRHVNHHTQCKVLSANNSFLNKINCTLFLNRNRNRNRNRSDCVTFVL